MPVPAPISAPVPARDHWEAVRLSWKCHHIPFGSMLIGTLAAASVLSAIFTIVAESPAGPLR